MTAYEPWFSIVTDSVQNRCAFGSTFISKSHKIYAFNALISVYVTQIYYQFIVSNTLRQNSGLSLQKWFTELNVE